MANLIRHKRGTSNPAASDFSETAELLVNTSDGGVFTKTDSDSVVKVGNQHEWEWYWVRYSTNVSPSSDTAADWTSLYETKFINETASPDAEGYVNTIDNVNSDGGFGGSTYGNLFGDLANYHTLISTNILVTEPFSVSITDFIGDDSHAIFINGAYVHGRKNCCNNSSYSYTFTKGWHRIDLIYGEGGGGDYIKMGWNPKDYTDNISEMYAHLGADNPNYTLERLKGVDGSDSGLDADLLDGQEGTYYTGYADTAISNLVASAPSTLNTLNELAAALGDDANFSTTVTNSIAAKLPLTGGQMTGNITFSGSQTVDGRDVSADGSKLDGIETGATADQTAAEILTAIKTVDGAGSGLDADLLDGQQGSYYLNYNNFTNTPTIPTNNNQLTNGAGYVTSDTQLTNEQVQDIVGGMVSSNTESGITVTYQDGDGTLDFSVASQTDQNFTTTLKNKLDGIASSATNVTNNSQLTNGAGYISDITTQTDSKYLRSNADDTATGDITFNGVVNIRSAIDLADNDKLILGSGDDAELFCDGSHLYLKLNSEIGNFYIRDGNETRFTFDDNGDFTATGNVTAYSDITLKKNIEVIPNALDKVMQLRGVTFDRKDIETSRQSGVIAQEVEKVLPEVVDTNEEGIKSVAYGNLVGLLIEAIKEQQIQIKELKTLATKVIHTGQKYESEAKHSETLK